MVGERVAPRRVAETVSESLVAVLGVPESGVGGHEVDPEPSPRLRARPIPAAAVPEPPVVDAGAAGGHVEPLDHQRRLRLGDPLAACVEINQCVGCTRQFFTKSFLGDDAAVLARSSGEEPASPRHRAGVASMAWRTTR